MTIIITVDSIE